MSFILIKNIYYTESLRYINSEKKMNKKKILFFLRNKINNIDYKIINLLSQREFVSIDILNSKISNQLNIRDKNREIKLFKNLKKISKKKNMNTAFIKKIFEIIVKHSISIQNFYKKKIIVHPKKSYCAYLGPIGSYSHTAFNMLAKDEKEIFLGQEHNDFSSIIKSLNNSDCQTALLPIENKISGIIPEVYDILKKQEEIYIIKEIYVKIEHQLLTVKNSFFSDIKNIYSHAQPFQQCSIFLKKFPKWKKFFFNSTSAAMKQLIKENKKTSAVIGNSTGGDFYNLKKIATNISNKKKNITRFILISKKKTKISHTVLSKITILLTLYRDTKKQEKIFNIFKKKKITIINKILHSNKKKTNPTYFIEIQENIQSKTIQDTFSYIKKYSKKIKILGCYPIQKNKKNV